MMRPAGYVRHSKSRPGLVRVDLCSVMAEDSLGEAQKRSQICVLAQGAFSLM